jgi:nucleotide-binding universal stress UspA family protein
MSAVTLPERRRSPGATRVLVAIHGSEPAGWGPEAYRTVTMWTQPSVRILAFLAVPCPPFTSLIPAAARRYRAARAAWEDAERARVQRVIDEIAPGLSAVPEVVWTRVSYRDPGRAIAEHARAWAADVLLISAAPAAGLWLGALHERIIRRVHCPVLVTPRSASGPGR